MRAPVLRRSDVGHLRAVGVGPAMKVLRAWVLLRLPLPLCLLLLAPSWTSGKLGEQLSALAYAHGAVKMGVLSWQSMLSRDWALLGFLVACGVTGLVLGRLRGRAWAVAAVVALVVLVVALRPVTVWTVPAAAAWLAVTCAPDPTLARWGGRWRAFAWIPGTELLFGPTVAASLGAGPGLLRVAATIGALLVGGAWIVTDTLAGFSEYERRLFEPWPDGRVDPRVTTILRAPAGVKSEFHDIDVVGDRAVVVAETTERLWSVPSSGPPASTPLPHSWGQMFGLVMDSETDPATGVTYHLDGPHHVAALRWDDGWQPVGRSARLPAYLHHVYLHLLPGQGLFAFTVGTKNTHDPMLMIELDLPEMRAPTVRRLVLPDGGPMPMVRDLAWVPPLGKFVLAPDFGDRLYLATPGNPTVEPWMEMPTLNGRLTWVPGLDRLVVPVPNRPELWLVDVQKATIERRIPTQPGVRTAAVDVDRGVFLTASVLTGRVLVQRLEDGGIVDSFGTLMPMSRNLALIPERGEAILSTWTALYRIPYADAR